MRETLLERAPPPHTHNRRVHRPTPITPEQGFVRGCRCRESTFRDCLQVSYLRRMTEGLLAMRRPHELCGNPMVWPLYHWIATSCQVILAVCGWVMLTLQVWAPCEGVAAS